MKCPHCNKEMWFRCRNYTEFKGKLIEDKRETLFETFKEAEESALFTTHKNGWSKLCVIELDGKEIKKYRRGF